MPEVRAIRGRHYSLPSAWERIRRSWMLCRQPFPYGIMEGLPVIRPESAHKCANSRHTICPHAFSEPPFFRNDARDSHVGFHPSAARNFRRCTCRRSFLQVSFLTFLVMNSSPCWKVEKRLFYRPVGVFSRRGRWFRGALGAPGFCEKGAIKSGVTMAGFV